MQSKFADHLHLPLMNDQPAPSRPSSLPNNLLTLQSRDCARIAVSLFGGQLCSWQTPDGRERLFVSTHAHWDGVHAIRGGVPIIFPQFGAGTNSAQRGPRHGIARTLPWTLHAASNNGDDVATMQLRLTDSEASKKMVDAEFTLTLTIQFSGTALQLTLEIVNTGSSPLPFCAALHTYLRTDISRASIHGLQHKTFRDAVDGGRTQIDQAPSLLIDREIDRLYVQSDAAIELRSDTGIIALSQSGFTDTVVWNPWIDKTLLLADCAPRDYLDFVCIEAALADRPTHLPPGQRWCGTQSFQVIDISEPAEGVSL